MYDRRAVELQRQKIGDYRKELDKTMERLLQLYPRFHSPADKALLLDKLVEDIKRIKKETNQ